MTPEEAVQALNALRGQEPEGAHVEADKILLKMVPEGVRAAYEALVEQTLGGCTRDQRVSLTADRAWNTM